MRGVLCRSKADRECEDGEEYTVKVVDEFGNFDAEFCNEFKSRDNGFSTAFDDSFDSNVINEIEMSRRGNIFMGCAQLKKKKEAKRNRGSEVEESQSMSPDRRGQVSMSPKFNASIVDDGNFPQIIFANDEEERLFREMNEPNNIQPFSSYTNQQRTRSPSPTRSRSSRLSRSPNRSPTRQEEQLLDSLARPQNYNNYDILQHAIAELTGREREALSQQLKEIPEFIGIDSADAVSEFDGKSVNERIKTKRINSKRNEGLHQDRESSGNYRYVNEVDEQVSLPDDRDNFHESGKGVASKLRNVDERSKKWRLREKDAVGFASSTMSMGKPPLHNLPNEVHRRKVFMPNQNDDTARDVPATPESTNSRRKLLPSPLPTTSLLDNDATTTSESCITIDEDGENSSFAFGGKEYRRSPLALAEGFEDFGIDDRIYPNQQASDTFDYDEDQEEDFGSCQSGSRSSSIDRVRHSNLMRSYITNQQRLGHSSKSITSDVSTTVSSSSRSLRSSKYQEVAGSAYRVSITVNENSQKNGNLVEPTSNELDTKSSLSGQTYQVSNTTRNIDRRQKGSTSLISSRSPQSVVDRRNW